MGKEDSRNLFRTLLSRRTNELEVVKREQLNRHLDNRAKISTLVAKFDREVEPALRKVEEAFLEQEPFSSIVGILEEAAGSIEAKSNIKLYRQKHFNIEVLGIHPITDYDWDVHRDERIRAKVFFTEAIEKGLPINNVITEMYLQFGSSESGHAFLFAAFKGVQKGPKNREVDIQVGGKTSNFKLDKFDISNFANILATKISQGDYFTPPLEPWSIN
jgi:hypothetical protein